MSESLAVQKKRSSGNRGIPNPNPKPELSLAVQKMRSSGNLRSQERAGGGSLAVQKKRSSGNGMF